MRLDHASGDVLLDASADVSGMPSSLVTAPNGRVLIGGYGFIDSSGDVGARMVESDAAGAPCRSSVHVAMFSGIAATAGAEGWSVLGSSAYVPNVGNDAVVRRYDADGPCDRADAIFADGFGTADRRSRCTDGLACVERVSPAGVASARSSTHTRPPACGR